MMVEHFWKMMWNKRAADKNIVESGGRSVRGNWQNQIHLTISSIKDRMQFNPEDSVLDIGCSGGMLIREISPFVSSVVGVDYSIDTVNKAKEYTSDYSNVEIIPANAYNLPFKNNTFSKIICYSVFMYLGNIERVKTVIAEIKRVSNNNARILIGDLLDKNKKPPLWSLELLRAQRGKLDVLQFLKENIGHHCGLHLWLDPETLKKYSEGLSMKATVLKQNELLQLSSIMFDLLMEVNKQDVYAPGR